MTDSSLQITRTVQIPFGEISFRFSRSGGPGGQNVNKVASKVELLFDVGNSRSLNDAQRARVFIRLDSHIDAGGVLHITVDSSRSQWANREEAQRRLVNELHDALRPIKKRIQTVKTRASGARRLEKKKTRSVTKRLRGRIGPDE